MVSDIAVRRKREANPEEFKRLLARLDPDPKAAWAAYYALRQKLVVFFEHNRHTEAEELAEEALDRIAKKTESYEIENVAEFAFGVARNLRREAFRQTAGKVSITDRETDIASKEDDPESAIVESIDAQRNVQVFRGCLRQLPPTERELILAYYPMDSENLEQRRQELAESLGISAGALRTRMARLREKLEQCFQNGGCEPAKGRK